MVMMVRDPVKKAYFRYFRRKVAWVLSSCLIFIAVNPVCTIALASEGGESIETVSEGAAPQDDIRQSDDRRNDELENDALQSTAPKNDTSQKDGKREVLSENSADPDKDRKNDKDIISVRIPTNFNIPMYNIGNGVEVRSDGIEIVNESDFPVDVYVTSVSASFIETGGGILQARNETDQEYTYDTEDMETYSNLTLSLHESGGKESIHLLKGGHAENVMKFTLGISEDAVKRSASANAGGSVSEENIPEEKVSENTAVENDGEEGVSENEALETDEENEIISDNELPDETSAEDESVSNEPENNEPESEEHRLPSDESSGEDVSAGDTSDEPEGEKDTHGEENPEETYDSGIWVETLEATPSDEPVSEDNKVFREVLDDPSDPATDEEQESIINNPEHEGSEIIQVTYKTEPVKQDEEAKNDEPDEDVSGNSTGDEEEDIADGGTTDEGSAEDITAGEEGSPSEESQEETVPEGGDEPENSDTETAEDISAVSGNDPAEKNTEEQESDNKDTEKPDIEPDRSEETVSDNESIEAVSHNESGQDKESLSDNEASTEEKAPERDDAVSDNSLPEKDGKLSLNDLVSGNIINNTVFNENGKRKVVGEDYEEEEEKDSVDSTTKSSGISVIGQDRAVLNLNGSMLSGLNTGGISCKIETNITFDFVKHEDTGDAEDVKDADISESVNSINREES